MTTPLRPAGAAAAALCLTAVIAAQAPLMDVKLGLWDITTKTNLGGAMSPMPKVSDEDLAKIPPAQRAQIEAMMKTAAGAPMTIKQCLTKEKYEKNLFAPQRPNQNCTQTITKNTKTVLEANVVCTSPASSGTVHIDAASPTAYQGTVKSKSTERGRQMEITIEMSGKWLGADCGDVK
ncbi:MAG TPA: DUF3617 domain-containing protein [Vicinamibacterales bacterium]|nr:DUF3617 domain-containing protein [Vicinamibacterales bacterium]